MAVSQSLTVFIFMRKGFVRAGDLPGRFRGEMGSSRRQKRGISERAEGRIASAELLAKNRIAIMVVLELNEFRFVSNRSNGQKAFGADRIV